MNPILISCQSISVSVLRKEGTLKQIWWGKNSKQSAEYEKCGIIFNLHCVYVISEL